MIIATLVIVFIIIIITISIIITTLLWSASRFFAVGMLVHPLSLRGGLMHYLHPFGNVLSKHDKIGKVADLYETNLQAALLLCL